MPATFLCKHGSNNRDLTQPKPKQRKMDGWLGGGGLSQQAHEIISPCRDTSLCLGGTRQVWHHLSYTHTVYSQGSDNNLRHSDRTVGPQSWACNCITNTQAHGLSSFSPSCCYLFLHSKFSKLTNLSRKPQIPWMQQVFTYLHCPVMRSQSGLVLSLMPLGEHSQPSQPSKGW